MADRTSSETTYTEAQVRERERKAFYTGACFEHRFQKRNERPSTMSEVLNEAAEHYPAPTKPRVVTVWNARHRVDVQYRFTNGVLEARWPGYGDWETSSQSPQSIRAIADLLAHPEEPAND